MSDVGRPEVLQWVQRVRSSLDEQARAEADDYQRLEPSARWARLAAACHRAVQRLDEQQRLQIERQAEIDARRFGELMRDIAARTDG